jgi:hypothetical protein
MPGHEVIEEALLVHGASGRLKQMQSDRRFFFEVFYKTKARVHAGTTEQSILGSGLDSIERTEIPAAIRRFLSATGKIRAEWTILQPCFAVRADRSQHPIHHIRIRVTMNRMKKRFGQGSDDSEPQTLPKAHRSFIALYDEVELHGPEATVLRVFE